jgi:cell shape-determining protein MreC
MERLKQENQILRTQIESVREWLLNEDRLQEQVERLKWLAAAQGHESEHQEFFQRRSQELAALLELQVASLPAQVIFREPSSWSSSIWLNVGEEDNIRLGKSVVGKNSPVLVGTSVIGAIDYVGKRKSRVRLITDSRVKPSVRVVRGREQNRYLLEHLESLIFALEVRQDLFSSPEELKNYAQQLNQLRTIFSRQSHDAYLAKGELQGTSSPLWRSRSEVLKGVGFSYDFSDREGPARDLRSGRVFGQAGRRADPLSILNAGDLLLTTGFDGVFPAGLRVAIVSKVDQLKEGASSYSIEAVSTAGNLDEIHHVSVLPPVSDPQSE